MLDAADKTDRAQIGFARKYKTKRREEIRVATDNRNRAVLQRLLRGKRSNRLHATSHVQTSMRQRLWVNAIRRQRFYMTCYRPDASCWVNNHNKEFRFANQPPISSGCACLPIQCLPSLSFQPSDNQIQWHETRRLNAGGRKSADGTDDAHKLYTDTNKSLLPSWRQRHRVGPWSSLRSLPLRHIDVLRTSVSAATPGGKNHIHILYIGQ